MGGAMFMYVCACRVCMLTQVDRVQQAVMHAHVWKSDEERLPRRINLTKFAWKSRIEFGIRNLDTVYTSHSASFPA